MEVLFLSVVAVLANWVLMPISKSMSDFLIIRLTPTYTMMAAEAVGKETRVG